MLKLPWEQRHLGNNASFSKGSGYSKADLREKGTPIILYGRLYTNYQPIIDKIDTFVEKKNGSVYSQAGDVIVPGSGETAEDISVASVVKNSGVILGGDLNVIHPNSKLDSLFLALSISNGSSHKDMARRAQGKSIVHLHINDLEQIKSYFPSIEEQKKIGQLFQSLDRTITLHEEKQRQLEQLKKALLQKMFADKKEYPELRFNGFSDSWNKNKVSELFTITRGYVLPAKDTKPTPEGDYCYPVYSSQTAQNGLMGYYNKYLYKDAITWTTDGANAGTVRFRTGKFYCTNVCGVLLTKKAKASEMIAMALNKVTKKYVSYVGNPKLMNNVMGEIVISLPTNTEEQNNLSFLFNNLERAIILTEHKIEQLKSLKQALLQQMFI